MRCGSKLRRCWLRHFFAAWILKAARSIDCAIWLGRLLPLLKLRRRNEPTIVRESGALVGRMLHALGFNLDLAPVLDLALPVFARGNENPRGFCRSGERDCLCSRIHRGTAATRNHRMRQAFSRSRRRHTGFAPGDSEHSPNLGANVGAGSGALPCAAYRTAAGDGESCRLSENRGAVATGVALTLLDPGSAAGANCAIADWSFPTIWRWAESSTTHLPNPPR